MIFQTFENWLAVAPFTEMLKEARSFILDKAQFLFLVLSNWWTLFISHFRQYIPKQKQIVIDFETIERNQTKPSGMKNIDNAGMGWRLSKLDLEALSRMFSITRSYEKL